MEGYLFVFIKFIKGFFFKYFNDLEIEENECNFMFKLNRCFDSGIF